MRLMLFGEIVTMAFDTVRSNKMRSALTVLGVVIGITSIVGMTAMIRGFDESLRDMIRTIGPDTVFVQRFGVTSFSSGAEIRDLLKRPNLTISDARAIEEASDTIGRLRADAQPVRGALGVELHALRVILGEQRVVAAEALDEAAIARAARVCDDDLVIGALFRTAARQANGGSHDYSLQFRVYG